MIGGGSRAKLAILSSCLSASGVQQFEGRLGLTYAFAFIGTPNVISSLWEVPDRESGEIFTHFYNYLDKGIPSTESLRQAKLQYLKEAPLPGRHPFYWAGWSVHGSQVKYQKAGIPLYIYLIGLLALAGFVIAGRRLYRKAL